MAQQMKSRVACVQMCSGQTPEANIDEAERLIRRAAVDGATLVATPEMTNVIESKRDRLIGKVGQQHDDPSVKRMAGLAGELLSNEHWLAQELLDPTGARYHQFVLVR